MREERTVSRIAVSLIGVALTITACGVAGVGDAGPITTVPPTTTETTGPPTTSGDEATTTTTAPDMVDVSVYFLLEDNGTERRPGPYLVPLTRTIERTEGIAAATLRELFRGPTVTERDGTPAMSTAIPENTLLLGLDVTDGLATVDLSREFESGGGSASMFGRLAQVVFTLTRFPTVDRVEFRLDGDPVTVFSGEGILLEGPVTRADYLDMVPFVFVDDPAWGGRLGNPARVVGMAAVFEATFQWALTDQEGLIIAEGFAMTDEGMGWGDFDFTFDYEVEEEQIGHLIVWEFSAEDGSRRDVREYPVVLTPSN